MTVRCKGMTGDILPWWLPLSWEGTQQVNCGCIPQHVKLLQTGHKEKLFMGSLWRDEGRQTDLLRPSCLLFSPHGVSTLLSCVICPPARGHPCKMPDPKLHGVLFHSSLEVAEILTLWACRWSTLLCAWHFRGRWLVGTGMLLEP